MPSFPPDLGDIFISNDRQVFTGADFQKAWILPTKDAALAFANNIASGGYDPFLKDAFSSIRITRNRDFEGHFAPGYAIVLSAQRPGPGQNSGDGPGGEVAEGPIVENPGTSGTTFTGNPTEGGGGHAPA
jgi:hypothetical protein